MSLSDEKTFSPTPIHSIPSYAPSFCLLFYQCHNESFMIVLVNWQKGFDWVLWISTRETFCPHLICETAGRERVNLCWKEGLETLIPRLDTLILAARPIRANLHLRHSPRRKSHCSSSSQNFINAIFWHQALNGNFGLWNISSLSVDFHWTWVWVPLNL